MVLMPLQLAPNLAPRQSEHVGKIRIGDCTEHIAGLA